MNISAVGAALYRKIKQIRSLRDITLRISFFGSKNRFVKRHVTLIRDAPRRSPCLISLGRDSQHLTKAFLRHYKDLGFKSFVFLDNNSKTGCVPHLMDEADALGCDVSIYSCVLSFRRFKHSMRNFLIESVPKGAWTFCADDDEFLVLPDGLSDVAQLITYLERWNYDTVQFHLLDMFSSQPLGQLEDETAWNPSDLEEHYPYYDISSLTSERVQGTDHLQHYGGVRLKHFGVNPFITKATFFKKVGRTSLWCSHSFTRISAAPRRKVADFTLFVKHYTFNSRYALKLRRAVDENSYYDNSSESRPILEKLSEDEFYTLHTESSLLYRDCEQLRACDFVTYSVKFQRYLENRV